MKYLIVIGLIFLVTNFSQAQMAQGKDYKYSVKFTPNTFDGEDVKDIVSDFREHVFASTNKKFDFRTRFNESGELYFETSHPVTKNIVECFFEERNKSYLSFNREIEAPTVYAFNTTK